MTSFKRAIDEIAMIARKADCKNVPRVSLSFDNEGDRARFEMEVRRELEAYMPVRTWGSGPYDMQELTLRGVRVRIL